MCRAVTRSEVVHCGSESFTFCETVRRLFSTASLTVVVRAALRCAGDAEDPDAVLAFDAGSDASTPRELSRRF